MSQPQQPQQTPIDGSTFAAREQIIFEYMNMLKGLEQIMKTAGRNALQLSTNAINLQLITSQVEDQSIQLRTTLEKQLTMKDPNAQQKEVPLATPQTKSEQASQ